MSTPALLDGDDLLLCLGLPVLGALAWLVPPSRWPDFCARYGHLNAATLTGDVTATCARIDALRGARMAGLPARDLLQRLAAEDLRATMMLMRCYLPGAATPRFETPGIEHLQAALQAGRGAILWVGHFVHNALGAKIALHQAGHAVGHLSHPRHGFSATRFGMHVLNRVRTVAEDRHLGARIRLGLSSPQQALDTVRSWLQDNRVVSITARGDSNRPLQAAFMDGYIRIAPGAPLMALRTGAALLPVVPLEDHRGRLQARIEAPLEVPAEHAEPLQALADAYAHGLEAAVMECPAQWLGWLHLR